MIGYKIDGAHRRNGYGRESVAFVKDLIFHELKLHRIEATVLPHNEASIRLLESLGFEREGYLRDYVEVNGEYRDHIMYAAISQEQ